MRRPGVNGRAGKARERAKEADLSLRPAWPVPKRDVIVSALRAIDSESLAIRVERVEESFRELGPPAEMLLVGGVVAMYALQEMRNCYVTENALAVILLAHSFIEHSLAGSIGFGDDDLSEGGFAKLIRQAREEEQLSEALYQRLDELRRMRNSYVHPKVGLKAGSHIKRFIDSGHRDMRDLADADALFALETVVDFLRHECPSWAPRKAAPSNSSGNP